MSTPPRLRTWTERTFQKASEAERLLCADRDQFKDYLRKLGDCVAEEVRIFIDSHSPEVQRLGFRILFIHLNQKRAVSLRPRIEDYFKDKKYMEHLLSQSSARTM